MFKNYLSIGMGADFNVIKEKMFNVIVFQKFNISESSLLGTKSGSILGKSRCNIHNYL